MTVTGVSLTKELLLEATKLKTLESIQVVNLPHQRIISALPALSHCYKLVILNLKGNRVDPGELQVLESFHSLKKLDLS